MKTILTTILLLSLTCAINAQWTEIGTIENDNIYNTSILNDNVIASGEKGSIYYINQPEPTVPKNIFSTFGFFNSYYTVDEDIAYIGGGCYFPFDECPANSLYLTLDGGLTWEPILSDKTFTGTGNINGILPYSDEELVIVLEYKNIFKINLLTGTSTEISLPDTDNINILKKSKISSNGNWLIEAQNYDVETGSYPRYYESNDKGETWTILDFGLEDDETVWHIDYKPDNTFSIISTKNKVYVYDGISSQFISDLPLSELSVSCQFIVDNDVIYVGTQNNGPLAGKLLRSTDGGLTWEDDSLPATNVINMVFTDRDNGYVITNFSKIHKRSGLDAVENLEKIEISISPNPVMDYITIKSVKDLSNAKVEIINLDGRVISSRNSVSKHIDVSDLESGIYFLNVQFKNGSSADTYKFVKL